MKKAYLSIDIEEWYHLDYLKTYEVNKNEVETIPQIFNFLDMLDRLNIKATFFILAEIAYNHADIIREIKDRGHEIGCHGLDHELLYNKTDEEFKEQIIEAKKILDSVIGEDVVKGYRASCFSMDRKKLDILKDCGYSYDSSYICFAEHPLYGSLDLSGYEKIEDLVYKSDDFLEFEIPTHPIGKFNIPISGGGYLRLLPYPVIRNLIKSYLSKQDNFILYIHPYELTDIKIPFSGDVPFKDKFRASVGRKGNLNKLEKVLLLLRKEGLEFRTFEQELVKSNGEGL
ncbi:polysaccharide deacetylase family protein [Bacillus infantis]|uniref:polysaccharide deacetylase family protein n=1 Tax=Bacillus infantis TaxID=324767 RepID=UPI003CFA38EA